MIISHCDKYYEKGKETVGLEVKGAALGRAVRESLSREVMDS